MVSGIRGAENGQANIRVRGTSSRATLYADYAGTTVVSNPVQLDASGAAIVYVNEEVDVSVTERGRDGGPVLHGDALGEQRRVHRPELLG
jgi:hypothetical protein